MTAPVAEIGHAPNRIYIDQAGNLHLNGATLQGNDGGSTSVMLESAADGLTALAGGGQPGATPLTAQMNRFATVATNGDSGLLPPSTPGNAITVTNAGVGSLNVFPSTGETIDALGANAARAVAAAKTCTFYCYTAGQWHSQLGA